MRILVLAILMTCSSGLAAQAQQAKDFKDWVVGCDNRRDCTAIGFMPADSSQNAFIKVIRAGDATAEPSVTFALWDESPEGPASLDLSLDGGGEGVPPKMEGTRDGQYARAVLTGDSARTALAAMRQASNLTIRLPDKAKDGTGTVSLAGSAAALLFMDAQQSRAKTVTALVGRGDAPASSIPLPPQTPVIAAHPMQEVGKPLPKQPAGIVRRR